MFVRKKRGKMENQQKGELTAEDIKKLSPAELQKLQRQNCIFCHICDGEVTSKKIYEDEQCVAILDINPANPGHVLLMPKNHYQISAQIPRDTLAHLATTTKQISHACLRALKVAGTNIFIANGVAAGQRSAHFMIHIIPRKEGDGVTAFDFKGDEFDDEQLADIKSKLSATLDRLASLQRKARLNSTDSMVAEAAHIAREREAQGKEEHPLKPSGKGMDLDSIAKLLGGGS